MSSNLSDRLLGISIDESEERRSREDGDDEAEYERFVFVELGERRLAIHVDDVTTITDPPTRVTRVPRSPEAIEGVTDLRGVITAVIDLRLQFPTREDPPELERLVVFETAPDQQPAAVRVDEVLGVESVPAEHVVEAAELASGSLDDAEFDAEDVDERVFEHPLVVAAVVKASDVTVGIEDLLPGVEADDDAHSSTDPFENLGDRDRKRGEFGDVFDEHEDVDVSAEEDVPDEEEREFETTALLDLDRLLAASGRT